MAGEYDVFLSYARDDDEQGVIAQLVDEIRAVYSQRTRRQLRIFVDRQEISTAQLWQERISSALHSSTTLIAIVTERYLVSKWCRNEWDHFAAQERVTPDRIAQPRIFPVFVSGEPQQATAAPAVQKWLRAIKSRQCTDLTDRKSSPDLFREEISRLTDGLIQALDQARNDDIEYRADRGMENHHMVTGYVKDGERFVALLTRATNVTIVGMTNEGLATMLQEALNRKRQIADDADAFWGSLRIVFLSDKLLNWLNDEKSEYPDPGYELSQRELAAGYGRRSIEGFLKRASSTKWDLLESPYFPPFAGALLEMPDGSRVVQLIMRRPQRRTLDHLYIEFEDPTDQYFAAAFEDIVHNSSRVDRVVPIGVPRNDGFLCTSSRFFQNVLVDGSGQAGWMPIVLIVTWWNRNGRAEPVLQVRTDANSTRELERVSHLAGYVYLDPYPEPSRQSAQHPAEFELPSDLTNLAAQNRIRMETGSPPHGELKFVATRQYLHADKEHFYFYIFEFELPGHFQFPQRAQMCHITVAKLLQIRKNQALRNAIGLLRDADEVSLSRSAAFEIVALNLLLHNVTRLGEEVRLLAGAPDGDKQQILRGLQKLEKESRESQRSGNLEVQLRGLSGLQFREFFTVLLPLYEKIGIAGAAEALEEIRQDEKRQEALKRLAVLYHDEDVMRNIPIEL